MRILGWRVISPFLNDSSSMVFSFILRFQEVVGGTIDVETEAVRIVMGTKTQTFVAAESSDPDPAVNSLTAIPKEFNGVAGTQTMTNVRPEAVDDDRQQGECVALPR
jgi:hypothetical protein